MGNYCNNPVKGDGSLDHTGNGGDRENWSNSGYFFKSKTNRICLQI